MYYNDEDDDPFYDYVWDEYGYVKVPKDDYWLTPTPEDFGLTEEDIDDGYDYPDYPDYGVRINKKTGKLESYGIEIRQDKNRIQ